MAVTTDSSANKKSLVCNHYKKPGHTKAQCYRLHGFPANFKFTKPKREESKKEDVHSANVTISNSPNI